MEEDIGQTNSSTPILAHRTEKQRIDHFRKENIPYSKQAHAFHNNLPSHYTDIDGVSLVTKYAHRKAEDFVRQAYSIRLNDGMFLVKDGTTCDEDMEDLDSSNETLTSLAKKCTRLNSNMSTLETLKDNTIPQKEICFIVLHLLRLLSATVSKGKGDTLEVKYDKIGYLWNVEKQAKEDEDCYQPPSENNLEEGEEFALPTPAREALLSVTIGLLVKKSILRSVSNMSMEYPTEVEEAKQNNYLLVINWEFLLRMLLRTCPYLNENLNGNLPSDSSPRQIYVVRNTSNLIRNLRSFFDQGIDIKKNKIDDSTSYAIWNLVESDVVDNSHSSLCFRGMILFYLFQPTRCSRSFYKKILPLLYDAWTSVDRCSDLDYLMITIFGRSRKYVMPDDFDWGPIRKLLLTMVGYWLQIPVSGNSADKSFPNTKQPKPRSMPTRLKSVIGIVSSYQEGLDFVRKLSKLLVFCIGKNDPLVEDSADTASQLHKVSHGTQDLLRLLSFVAPYFNPSNYGSWSFPLGIFLHSICYECCHRVALSASQTSLSQAYPLLGELDKKSEPFKRDISIPGRELVAIIDALLPLCQQTLYSKSEHISRAGESALLYLSQIDPVNVCPPFVDFALQALDISSVTLSHQAPAALSVLARLVQPSLRHNSSTFLRQLPNVLHLSLAGIDCNDQAKTLRTLILYRSLCSWLPIGTSKNILEKEVDTWNPYENDGTWQFGDIFVETLSEVRSSTDYEHGLSTLTDKSILYRKETPIEDDEYLNKGKIHYEEACQCMVDWSLEFLERVYGLLRAAGEQEKVGKSKGVASRHSSADVLESRNFSRVLRECVIQMFSAMDEKSFLLASKSVLKFMNDETLPMAAKDASSLAEAVGAVRSTSDRTSTGLLMIVPSLTNDLLTVSKNCALYRVRCLSGAVRQAGLPLLQFRANVWNTLEFTLTSENKHIFKSGCKLLRHTLYSQSHSYPIVIDTVPSVTREGCIGKPSQLRSEKVEWHTPNGEQIDFVADILMKFVFGRIQNLLSKYNELETNTKKEAIHEDLKEWRQCLKILRYAIRGCSNLFVESDSQQSMLDADPHEIATLKLLSLSSPEKQTIIVTAREEIKKFLALLLLLASTEFSFEQSDEVAVGALIASDTKVCREAAEISKLILTKRGSSSRSQDSKVIWDSQKELIRDNSLAIQKHEIVSTFEKLGDITMGTRLYKDGEEGGKSLSRRLVTARVTIFLQSVQKHSSYEVPRRLRRSKGKERQKRTMITGDGVKLSDFFRFSMDASKLPMYSTCHPLDNYEDMIDALMALACHSNSRVRSSSAKTIEQAFSRFGWFADSRKMHLITSASVERLGQKGSARLTDIVKDQESTSGRKKRLSEILKGVCSTMTISRVMKEILASEDSRYLLVKTICNSHEVISQLPPEDMNAMLVFYHHIFSQFRSRFFRLRRVHVEDIKEHSSLVNYLLSVLNHDSNGAISNEDGKSSTNSVPPIHWRQKLLATWFLLTALDRETLMSVVETQKELWDTCFHIIRTEIGQPLQRASLGLLGRLTFLSISNLQNSKKTPGLQALCDAMGDSEFCDVLGNALVFDHKEDNRIGGRHKAQWSIGIEDCIKDAGFNIAPRILFPVRRLGRSSSHFKLQHALFLQNIVLMIGISQMQTPVCNLLTVAKELIKSSPSEDQRNQLCTSAEIFAGVLRAILLIQSPEKDDNTLWQIIFDYLDEAISKVPISSIPVFSDALRYGIYNISSRKILPLTTWTVENVKRNIWIPRSDYSDSREEPAVSDGFAEQSKWLALMSAVISELDCGAKKTGTKNLSQFYAPIHHSQKGITSFGIETKDDDTSNLICERLLSNLLKGIGNPYQKSREDIAYCLFRIYYFDRKVISTGNVANQIIQTLLSIAESDNAPFQMRQHSLITVRVFLFYCVRYGDHKDEFSNIIIPLLELAFDALNPDDSFDISPENRMLEAQVIKGFRYTIADIGASCVVSYNRTLDMSKVLNILDKVSKHNFWQVRQAAAHFLRCFQGGHKFLFSMKQTKRTTKIVTRMLADERREVSNAAMSALTGILAATTFELKIKLVEKHVKRANRSVPKKKKKGIIAASTDFDEAMQMKEKERLEQQQTSVFFLCAAVLAEPYGCPPIYIPKALAALSKHSFERVAPLGVRETVKFCCSEFKRTHMSDNWEVHRQQFTREQLEALDDVISSSHYYA